LGRASRQRGDAVLDTQLLNARRPHRTATRSPTSQTKPDETNVQRAARTIAHEWHWEVPDDQAHWSRRGIAKSTWRLTTTSCGGHGGEVRVHRLIWLMIAVL